MPAPTETLLATLPGENTTERVLICHCTLADGASRVELRQQSFGEGVGWFTQSSVALQPQQITALRGALGGSAPQRSVAPSWQPRVVRADIA